MAVVIKTFSTPGGMYVYDRETNSLLSVSKEEFDACQRVEANTAGEADWDLLKRYTERGYLKESCLKGIEHPASSFIPFHLDKHMIQLTMQVTQDCNLRCSYCTYGGGYSHQRTHSNKRMTLSTMKKCVDFIMARSTGVDEICIGFYGGEPLLEYDNIKKCVAYVNEKYCGRSVRYTITTNGTCIDDDMLQFVNASDININISFDGPRELHDMNRKYEDGTGSFDGIMRNVAYIKEKFPHLYGKISFMTTIAPGVDFSCINDFFNVEDVLAGSSYRYNTVSEISAKEKMNYDDMYTTTYNYQITKVLLAALGMYSNEKVSKLFASQLSSIEIRYSSLSKGGMLEKSHPGGPCVPGAMRPFIDVDGNIFPCERVSEGSEVMQIGHIDTGFDKNKIHEILNIGQLTIDECSSCWSFTYCGLCAAACDDGSSLSRETKLGNCESVKNNALNSLATICLLIENGYNFDKKQRC